jgi:hypothetical protein
VHSFIEFAGKSMCQHVEHAAKPIVGLLIHFTESDLLAQSIDVRLGDVEIESYLSNQHVRLDIGAAFTRFHGTGMEHHVTSSAQGMPQVRRSRRRS